MQHGAEEAFFEPLWGRGMMPDRTQVLAEAEYLLALLLTERDVPLLQRCQAGRSVLHPFQRVVPAMFSCPRDQTVVGIGHGILPPGPLRFIARFGQRVCQRLSLEVLLRGHLRQGL